MRSIAVLALVCACGSSGRPAETTAPPPAPIASTAPADAPARAEVDSAAAAPLTCDAPAAVTGEIAAIQAVGGETRATFNVGADDAVSVGWIGRLVLGDGRRVCFEIDRVNARSSKAALPIPFDVASKSSLTVELFRP